MEITTVDAFDVKPENIEVNTLDSKAYPVVLTIGGIRFFFTTIGDFTDFVDTLRFAATTLTDPTESMVN